MTENKEEYYDLTKSISKEFSIPEELTSLFDIIKPYQLMATTIACQAKREDKSSERYTKLHNLYNLINEQAFNQVTGFTQTDSIPMSKLLESIKLNTLEELKEALQQAEKDAEK